MAPSSPVRIEIVAGNALKAMLPDLARLRTAVFREWPYLYDGDDGSEERYLGTYTASHLAAVVVALDGASPVGMSTCIPLAAETENVRAPFLARGWDTARFFYFGESVLLPAFRGRGIGVEFFHRREEHARRVSAVDFSCFCAVQRPAEHPGRPAGYVPLDEFWRRAATSSTRT
jgi:GNAT superfamily N-acetyltransferase